MAEQQVLTTDGLTRFKGKCDEAYLQKNKTGADAITFRDGTVQDALDELLYEPVKITSFTNTVNTVENGATVDDVTLNWSIDGSPTSIKLDDVAQDLKATSKALTKLGLTANKSWTLVATDGKTTSTKTTGVYFKNKRYWGVGKPANADAITNEFILGLSGSELADNFQKTFTVTAEDGNYIFFAIPESWGTPRFFVGGFEGGFSLVKTFDFTNASGATVSYNVYQSGNANLGDTTVNVQK